ncbi:chorismate-binding protein [Flagellimonas meridianipacifica]|uniref:isochorismate synthase n=1 Tax=Flagellimonas meridianipacifica TaxID=1080225 RepID=A0A2T0MCE0_9FLAO|nr:chorismate-binding protein [Allomuricauda pacifica]PRX55177.1 isochorismate synthase [Allomuricauda pacifica]
MLYPENKEFQHLLDKVKNAIEQRLPVCLYRKPNQEKVKAVFQNSDQLLFTSDFENTGFVFAPFDLRDNAVLLRPDKILSATYLIPIEEKGASGLKLAETGKSIHLDLVEKGLKSIAKGDLEKVVLSRKIEIKHQISPENIVLRLLNAYPSAFCYLFFHPKIGLWCGASPETFLQVENDEVKTMSLAGTLPYQPNAHPEWGQKELDEQAMVTDFIKNRLLKEVDDLQVNGPESSKAGLLWHLKTELRAKLSLNSSLKDIVKSLHPTPAVCGLPFDESKKFILEHEGYNRAYYTGFLGELSMGESPDTSLYVNLRCMELTQNGASIYVGGGITADSNPEKEWEEIQNKSKTMLRLLQIPE